MLAVHLNNLLFLLFVAIAIFFQILTRAATKARRRPGDTTRRSTSPSQSTRPLSQDPDESDQERIRKFLEALGQPTTSKPPEPVAPRPTYRRPAVLPHLSPMKSPLPPLKTRPPDLPPEIIPEGPPPLELLPVIKTAVEAYEIAAQPFSKPAGAKIDLVTMLKSTSGLRNAILLREIFGPPRSLQPLDLVGTG
jgi:hypothetical protein